MYRHVKCVLITVVACLLLLIISQLRGRDIDEPSNVLQPAYRIENRKLNNDETIQKLHHDDRIEKDNRGTFQKPQPNNIKNNTGQSAHQSIQRPPPDDNRDRQGQSAHQILQKSRPEFPRQPVSTQVLQMVVPLNNPVPSSDVLQSMSHIDVQAFYHSYINSPQIPCSKVERMGKLTDGGWELCDDPLYRPLKGDCLVYSYGINFDFSYDNDMSTYGCEVHAFDPSMNMAPKLFEERVFFHPYGVGAKNESIVSNKNDMWQLYTVGEHRKLLQHTPDQRRLDIVKMDVEGYELDSLMKALDDGSLSDVRQLAFETHVSWHRNDPTKEEYMKFLALFRKVYEKGFRIFATHRNYQWSAFESLLVKGKTRAHCHEVHTININFRNTVNKDGTVVGDGEVKDATRLARHNQQLELLELEKLWYQKFHAPKLRHVNKGS